MRLSKCLFALLSPALIVAGQQAHAQSDATTTLGRDVATPLPRDERPATDLRGLRNQRPVLDSAPILQNGIFVGSINVVGTKALTPDVFAPDLEPWLGKTVNNKGLSAIARSVASKARAMGYIFASALVPQQSVEMGIVRVELDEGAIDEVRIIGSDNRRLKSVLTRLVSRAALKADVERQILLAGDLPGVNVTSTRYAREDGKGVLIVEVSDDRVRASSVLENYGSRAIGPVRARLALELTGLLDDGDALSLNSVVTPLDPNELVYVSARYTIAPNEHGTQIALFAALGQTKPGDRLPAQRSTGQSLSGGINISHPLLRSDQASLWLNGEIGYLRVEQDLMGLVVQRDELTTVTLSASGNVRLAGGRLAGGVGLVAGLGLPGDTGANDPLASRSDGSGQFAKGFAWLNWQGQVANQISLRVAANGQVASRPLLAAQEIGFGGPGFGRGYHFSERFGDGGVMGLIELRRHFKNVTPFMQWAQLYGFVDGGYIYNLKQGFGGGSLISSGAGLRGGIGKAEFGIEAAMPINAPRYESGDKSPRVNVLIGYNF